MGMRLHKRYGESSRPRRGWLRSVATHNPKTSRNRSRRGLTRISQSRLMLVASKAFSQAVISARQLPGPAHFFSVRRVFESRDFNESRCAPARGGQLILAPRKPRPLCASPHVQSGARPDLTRAPVLDRANCERTECLSSPLESPTKN